MSETLNFLNMIFGENPLHDIELRALPAEGGGPVDRIFGKPGDIAAEFLRTHTAKGNGVYVGVCLRRAGSHTGTRAAVVQCPGLWIDIDSVKNGSTIDDDIASLQGAQLPPSIIVRSGGGVHGYWLFPELLDVSENGGATEKHIVACLKILAERFGGDPSVCDLARIMRLPGSQNTKTDYLPKNPAGLPVEIADLNGSTYELEDIELWLAPRPPLMIVGDVVARGQVPVAYPRQNVATGLNLGTSIDVDREFASMRYRAGGLNGINATQLRVTGALVRQGANDNEIVSTVLAATQAAAGADGANWNWPAEERKIRRMTDGARSFHGNSNLHLVKAGDIVTPHASTVSERVLNPTELAGKPVPLRKWLVQDLIPQDHATLFTGDGGVGKSLIMQQLLTAVATGRPWLGIPTHPSRAFGLFCEDDVDELHRRQVDICDGLQIDLADLGDMKLLSSVGADNTLMAFGQRAELGYLTPFYHNLMDYLRDFRPGLVVIDTLADTFGGNEIIRNQVRSFINGALNSICKELNATVILCGHPSRAGKQDDEGYSGSTAWHNSVRSRLYLQRPKDPGADEHERILTNKKNNYGKADIELTVQWHEGYFKPTTTPTGMEERLDQDGHDRKFLELLAALTATGRDVNDAPTSPNYAVARMMKLPGRGNVKKQELEQAKERLFARGAIKLVPVGYQSRNQKKIVIVKRRENDAE